MKEVLGGWETLLHCLLRPGSVGATTPSACYPLDGEPLRFVPLAS